MGLTYLLLSLLFSSVAALTTSELSTIRAKLERKVIRGSNVPTAVRLAFHDCVGWISNPYVKDIFWLFWSTGGCNGCLNLDNPSNFGLEDLVDELETLYQDEGYSSLISRWTLIYIEAYNLTQPCTKQGRFLGACWHRCRWQGHRERQRGLRLRRLRRSRLWPHFPMGTSSRCSTVQALEESEQIYGCL